MNIYRSEISFTISIRIFHWSPSKFSNWMHFLIKFNFIHPSKWHFLIKLMKIIEETVNSCRLPWDQRTIRGYIGETVFSVISSSLYLHTNVVFLTFFIAICEFNQAFSNYFDALIAQFHSTNEFKGAKSLLCYIIRYHVSIKRYDY